LFTPIIFDSCFELKLNDYELEVCLSIKRLLRRTLVRLVTLLSKYC
jgi:hypothetical protein